MTNAMEPIKWPEWVDMYLGLRHTPMFEANPFELSEGVYIIRESDPKGPVFRVYSGGEVDCFDYEDIAKSHYTRYFEEPHGLAAFKEYRYLPENQLRYVDTVNDIEGDDYILDTTKRFSMPFMRGYVTERPAYDVLSDIVDQFNSGIYRNPLLFPLASLENFDIRKSKASVTLTTKVQVGIGKNSIVLSPITIVIDNIPMFSARNRTRRLLGIRQLRSPYFRNTSAENMFVVTAFMDGYVYKESRHQLQDQVNDLVKMILDEQGTLTDSVNIPNHHCNKRTQTAPFYRIAEYGDLTQQVNATIKSWEVEDNE